MYHRLELNFNVTSYRLHMQHKLYISAATNVHTYLRASCTTMHLPRVLQPGYDSHSEQYTLDFSPAVQNELVSSKQLSISSPVQWNCLQCHRLTRNNNNKPDICFRLNRNWSREHACTKACRPRTQICPQTCRGMTSSQHFLSFFPLCNRLARETRRSYGNS